MTEKVTDGKLYTYNFAAGTLHLVQGMGMLYASQAVDTVSAFKTDITRSYLVFNPQTQALEPKSTKVGEAQIAVLAAVFLLLSAVAHFIVI